MVAKYETGADKRLTSTLLENLTPSFKEIPVIELSAMNSPDLSERVALAKEIRKACENVGFFYISNHGTLSLRTD
jgi:isopenicillin N synthase-like dioxygenase